MDVKVKICGLTSFADIELINQCRVDYVGFVFATSKRQITVNQAVEMIRELRGDIYKVGVFVDAPLDEINRIKEACRLDIVQLHGSESPDFIKKIEGKVWKAVSMQNPSSLMEAAYYDRADGILLDGVKAGSGKVFDWQWVGDFSKTHYTILAGGLHAENVQQAVNTVRPHVVDVSSGVEADGKKNKQKIIEFIRKVKNNENES